MPQTRLLLFREASGQVPLLEWLDVIPRKARAKCIVRLERLALLGHELRRPESDLLRDGVYELRVRLGSVNYRILYFFHGQQAVVVSHGLTKERVVPTREIDLAVRRMQEYRANPAVHTHEEELS